MTWFAAFYDLVLLICCARSGIVSVIQKKEKELSATTDSFPHPTVPQRLKPLK